MAILWKLEICHIILSYQNDTMVITFLFDFNMKSKDTLVYPNFKVS